MDAAVGQDGILCFGGNHRSELFPLRCGINKTTLQNAVITFSTVNSEWHCPLAVMEFLYEWQVLKWWCLPHQVTCECCVLSFVFGSKSSQSSWCKGDFSADCVFRADWLRIKITSVWTAWRLSSFWRERSLSNTYWLSTYLIKVLICKY